MVLPHSKGFLVVETDRRTVSRWTRSSKQMWSVDAVGGLGEFDRRPNNKIRCIELENAKDSIEIVSGKHTYSHYDLSTGKLLYSMAD